MLVFAGSRCYKSQVTAGGPHPPEPTRESSLRIRGRRNASEEETQSQEVNAKAVYRQEEVDSKAVHRQEVDGQAVHRQEVDRQAPRRQEGSGQAPGGEEKHHREGRPQGRPEAGGSPESRRTERPEARRQPV